MIADGADGRERSARRAGRRMAAGWKATRANFQRDGARLAVAGGGDPPAARPPRARARRRARRHRPAGRASSSRPAGSVLITDGAETMVEAAREHAEEVGATNVELRTMQAEWIDLPTASRRRA